MTSTQSDPLELARTALWEGKPGDAVGEIRKLLGYPAGDQVPGDRVAAALAVLADAAAAAHHVELAEASRLLSADIDDPDRMFALGYQLLEAGLPAIAATILRRCYDAVGASEQVVTELVAALEGVLAYREAAELLRASPLLADSFVCRYLHAFNSILAGDLAAARAMLPRLVPADAAQDVQAARITAFLDRADRVAVATRLDDLDLRGWHYVVSDSILTHLSPYGFDQPMHGRYAWLQDSPARIITGVARLARVLEAWGIAPPCVYAPPGDGHDVVAALVSTRLGVPVAGWPAVGVPAPGVIAIYDLDDVDERDLARLHDRRSGQIVYAHGSPWAVAGPLAADVTTLLHQILIPPWKPTLTALAGEVVTRAADPRSAADIAADLARSAELDAADTSCDDLDALDRLVAAAGPPTAPHRERLWAGSPVESNRFD